MRPSRLRSTERAILLSIIQAAGWPIWPLLICSIAALALIIERFSSLRVIVSSGVMWGSETKQGLLKHHDMMLMDTMGSTEGGMASAVSTRDTGAQTAKFQLSAGV